MKPPKLKIRLKDGKVKEISNYKLVAGYDVDTIDIPNHEIEEIFVEMELDKPRIELINGLIYTVAENATIATEECDDWGNPLLIPVKEIGKIIHRRKILKMTM